MDEQIDKKVLAYVTGLAIGDGNLSNPNGRAVRLRISCDTKYPNLIKRICVAIKKILPNNKVSIIQRRKVRCLDISCYSNKWEGWLGWEVGKGSKYIQKVSIPLWIKANNTFAIECLRGLLETDGSIYIDRGYKMVNFVTVIPCLANDVKTLINKLGFKTHIYEIPRNNKIKYTIRLSKNAECFTKMIKLNKN